MDSEQEIWNCINDISGSKTLIIISHRLSTIQNADIIYVLENGVISQSGTHETLMSRGGLYRSLVYEQEKLEKLGEEREENA